MNDARGVGLAGLDARKTEVSMSILNSILEQVGGDATVQNLAAKVGLSPEKTEQAIAALGQAHGEEGDTVETASQATGVPTDTLSQIVGHIGGEGALGRFASLLEDQGGASSLLGGLKSIF
jgi:hypothetical protein